MKQESRQVCSHIQKTIYLCAFSSLMLFYGNASSAHWIQFDQSPVPQATGYGNSGGASILPPETSVVSGEDGWDTWTTTYHAEAYAWSYREIIYDPIIELPLNHYTTDADGGLADWQIAWSLILADLGPAEMADVSVSYSFNWDSTIYTDARYNGQWAGSVVDLDVSANSSYTNNAFPMVSTTMPYTTTLDASEPEKEFSYKYTSPEVEIFSDTLKEDDVLTLLALYQVGSASDLSTYAGEKAYNSVASDFNLIVKTHTYSLIPLPAAFWLLVTGLAVLAGFGRKLKAM